MGASGVLVRSRVGAVTATLTRDNLPILRGQLSQLRKLRDESFQAGRLDLATELSEELTVADPGRESYFWLGFMYRETGNYGDALRALRRARCFSSGPEYLIPEIHLQAAHTWCLVGNLKRMGEALRRAYSGRPKPRSASAFHYMLGNFYFAHRRYREACSEYARAEATGANALYRGRAILSQGLAMFRLRNLKEARQQLDRALRIHERNGHSWELVNVRMARATLHAENGQLHRAFGIFLRAARCSRLIGNAARESEALLEAGHLAGQMGQPNRGRPLLDRAVRLATETGQWNIAASAYACRATACACLKDFAAAEESVLLSQRFLRGKRNWVATLHLYRAHARITAMLDNWVETCRWARRAERLSKKVGDISRVIEFRVLRAEAEEQLGRKRASEYALGQVKKLAAVRAKRSSTQETFRKQAIRLAPTQLPILLVGESGTGKTALAHEIHSHSRRSKGPYVVVPCEQLVFPESDLGGHVKGAWSGAQDDSEGLFRKAEGGTLVLDRVDELSKKGQRVLIRMVEGYVRPVGGPRECWIDTRVLATCRQPSRLIPDLRERLSGAVLEVPPLRERQADFPALVEGMLLGRRKITCDAIAELARARWEGNLAELNAVVERLVSASDRLVGVKLVRRVLLPPELCRHRRLVDKKRRLAEMAAALV